MDEKVVELTRRLLDEWYIADTLNMTDEEILSEFRECDGDPEAHAAYMREMFRNAVALATTRKVAI